MISECLMEEKGRLDKKNGAGNGARTRDIQLGN